MSSPESLLVSAETSRGAGTVDSGHLLYSFGYMVVVVTLGSIVFNRVEQTFIDRI